MRDQGLRQRIDRRIAQARLALFWEDLWPRLALPLAIVALFVILSLGGLWDWVAWQVHAGALALFAVALVGALVWRLRGLAWPDREAARRRVERATGTVHRPLQVLDDRLPSELDSPEARALWEAHRRRLAAAVAALRVGAPRAGIARRDPWALRAVFGLALAVVVVFAGADGPARLGAALQPDIGGVNRAAVAVDAWLGPPAYTGLPPTFLTRDGKPVLGAEIAAPTGSTLLARVHGLRRPPVLLVDGREVPFAPLEKESWQISLKLNQSVRLGIKAQSRDLAAWPVQITPDRAPEITFAAPPKPAQGQTLEISFAASDDYGVRRAGAEFRRLENGQPAGEPFILDLAFDANQAREVEATASHDLTAHPWAGERVAVRLFADDALGQRGESAVQEIVLPARTFSHPVARAVIEQRKRLALRPETRLGVANVLGALAMLPDLYGGDLTAMLGLRTARTRLRGEDSPALRQEMVNLLWDVAIRIEEGNLTDAERALRQAQQALQDALARNAPDEEIERLAQELKRALDRYMQAMAERAQEAGEEFDEAELDENTQIVTPQDLQRMIDRAREMARRGARDAARDLLAEMQRMLDAMRNSRVVRSPEAAERLRQRQAQRGQRSEMNRQMGELNEMMRRQQELLDRSFRQNQERQRGQRGQQQQGQQQQGQQGQQGGRDAEDQEQLRRRLGEMLRRLQEGMQGREGQQGQQGGPGDRLAEAERQMGMARDALRDGQPGQAMGPQGQALDALRQGAQDMMRQLAEQMGEGQGEGEGDPRGDRMDQADARNEDPLGRNSSQPDEGLSTRVPTEMEAQRSREILEELYRRSGDRRRPQLERDYIDRLLRRF